MLRKVYLTNSLPETSLISPKTHPDLLQSLAGYQKEKGAYRADAPTLRPHPMEKYDRRRGEDVEAETRDEEIIYNTRPEDVGDLGEEDSLLIEHRYAGLVHSLPKHAQQRAWRLLPYLLDKDMGDLNMKDVLYDLVVKNVKKLRSQNLATLSSIYRQLDGDLSLPKSYYTKKPLPKTVAAGAHGVREAMNTAPPGRRNLPPIAPLLRAHHVTPLYHTKASSAGSRAGGDEVVTSTPLGGAAGLLTPLTTAVRVRGRSRKKRQSDPLTRVVRARGRSPSKRASVEEDNVWLTLQ